MLPRWNEPLRGADREQVPRDLAPLGALGLSDREIVNTKKVVGYFKYVNRSPTALTSKAWLHGTPRGSPPAFGQMCGSGETSLGRDRRRR